MFPRLLSSFLLASTIMTGGVSAKSVIQKTSLDSYPGEEMKVYVNWGAFNPDGTPVNAAGKNQTIEDLSAKIRFLDSVARLSRVVNFEKGEDSLDPLSDLESTAYTSKILGSNDGLVFTVKADFSQGKNPSIYYWTTHEARNVTLSLADLKTQKKLEYVIDNDSRYKIFFTWIQPGTLNVPFDSQSENGGRSKT